VPAPQKSEQRLNGIAISWGGCDFPRVQATPGMPSRARCTVMQSLIIALLTVAAILQKDSLDEKF
jgi:hypothetical protein